MIKENSKAYCSLSLSVILSLPFALALNIVATPEAASRLGKDRAMQDRKVKAVKNNIDESQIERNRALRKPEELPVDPALVSILRDICQSLKSSKQAQEIKGYADKRAFSLGSDALEKALEEPDLISDRILSTEDTAHANQGLALEVLQSNEIKLSDSVRASVVAIWAKRLGGAIAVTIIGHSSESEGSGERPLGDFVVWLNGSSSLSKGFDIQSQSTKTFWIGKLDSIRVGAGLGRSPRTSLIERHFSLSALPKRRQANAIVVAAAAPAATPTAAPVLPLPETKPEKDIKSQSDTDPKSDTRPELEKDQISEAPTGFMVNVQDPLLKYAASASSEQGSPAPHALLKVDENGRLVPPPAESLNTTNNPNAVNPDASRLDSAQSGMLNSRALDDNAQGNKPEQARHAGSKTRLFYPDRVLAGRPMTVSAVQDNYKAESSIELNFNDHTHFTSENGHLVFNVPEDSSPGRSLEVLLKRQNNQEERALISVLHPLISQAVQTSPKIDSMPRQVAPANLLSINGHGFNGEGGANRVLIDGGIEGRVLAASPVQLKVLLPDGLKPGRHSLKILAGSIESNSLDFELVRTDLKVISADPPAPGSRKLVLRILGTERKMKVRLINLDTKAYLLPKGADMLVTTSGGKTNLSIVQARRVGRGQMKIEANPIF